MRDIRDFDVLILPGWHNSEPGHWQSEWQAMLPNTLRVEQEDWETPSYVGWEGTFPPLLLIVEGRSCWSRTASGRRL